MVARWLKILSLVVLLMLLLPASVFAAPLPGATGNYNISGRVTIGDPAEGLKGVKVVIGKYNDVTDAQGNYSLRLPSGASGDLTATLAGYRFTPAKISISNLTANQENQSFSAVRLVKMSGRVTVQGKPVKDATVAATYTDSNLAKVETTTDTKGNYSLWVDKSELTPSATHRYFTFADAAKVTPSADFTQDWKDASLVVSGAVTEDGLPAANIIMRIGSLAAATDSSGKYSFTLKSTDATPLASLKVAPEPLAGFDFSPAARALNPATAASQVDFVAERHTNPVSGVVKVNEKALAGVRVSDGKNTATTDAKGAYTLKSVAFGRDVTLTAFKYGYTIAALSSFNMPDQAVKGKNFTAAKLDTPRKLSGKVVLAPPDDGTGAGGGKLTPIKDVLVTLRWNGQEVRSVRTDKNGAFSFTSLLADAGHTIQFTHPNYVFLPAGAQAQDLTSGDVTGLSITASRVATLSGALQGVKEGTQVSYTLNGQNGSLTVGKGGKYSLPDLKAGKYTLALQLSGYVFQPATFAFEVKNDTSKVTKNFAAKAAFAVSGHVYDKEDGTTGLEGATVKLGDLEVKTGAGGAFSFPAVAAGKYTLTVTLQGKTFPNKTVTVKNAPIEDLVVKAK